jgi:predicted Rdx family selenoprotein
MITQYETKKMFNFKKNKILKDKIKERIKNNIKNLGHLDKPLT